MGQILLVGQDEHRGMAQIVVGEQGVQCFCRFAQSMGVIRVNHENQALRAVIVLPPQRPLATNVPHCKANVAVLDRFDVETNRRNGLDYFSQLLQCEEFVI